MFEVGEDAKSKIWGLKLHLPHIDETRLELGLVDMINGSATLKLGTPFAGPLIERRKIRPVLLVGIWHGDGPFTATYPPDKRGKEYLPGADADPKTYAQHEDFVKNEVMPLAEKSETERRG